MLRILQKEVNSVLLGLCLRILLLLLVSMSKFSKDEKFSKLSLRSSFDIWDQRIKSHFTYTQCWEYVCDGHEPTAVDGGRHNQSLTVDQIKAGAFRDILDALDDDVLRLTAACANAHDVYSLIKKMFVGFRLNVVN